MWEIPGQSPSMAHQVGHCAAFSLFFFGVGGREFFLVSFRFSESLLFFLFGFSMFVFGNSANVGRFFS